MDDDDRDEDQMDVDAPAVFKAKNQKKHKMSPPKQKNKTSSSPTTKTTQAASTPTTIPAPIATSSAAATTLASGHHDISKMLNIYYRQFFPFKELSAWWGYDTSLLSVGKKAQASHVVQTHDLLHREFSFQIPLHDRKDTTIIRFRSYNSDQSLKEFCATMNPVKLDIGAIYSLQPSQKHMHPNIVPVQRELVFDIDLDDYNPIRACPCKNSNERGAVCKLCWYFIDIAMRVVHAVLVEDFGFKDLVWIFSGRRGVHCWVADHRARVLKNNARAAIVNYISLLAPGENKAKQTKNLEPLGRYQKIYDHILQPSFASKIVGNHGVLGSPEKCDAFLDAFLKDSKWEKEKKEIKKMWDDDEDSTTSQDKWKQFKSTIEEAVKEARNKKGDKRAYGVSPVVEAVFTYTYPRLDIGVSKETNHLLKSPFCVHPETKKICVPIPSPPSAVEETWSWDYSTVPTLQDVIAAYDRDANANIITPYVDAFTKEFLRPVLNREAARVAEEKRKHDAKQSDNKENLVANGW